MEKLNKTYGGQDTVERLHGKALIDKISTKDGFITRDVGYELLMGYKASANDSINHSGRQGGGIEPIRSPFFPGQSRNGGSGNR